MDIFLTGLLKAALYHAGGVASPGPDFAIVLHQSIRRGRRAAIFTSLGIATGIFAHVGYSLFLLEWLSRDHPNVLEVAKYLGAAYLAYIGIRMLWGSFKKPTNEKPADAAADADAAQHQPEGDGQAFRRGLLVNLFNPKVALFFFAGFTNPSIVNPAQPLAHRVIYGCWMVFATAVWFVCVSCFFSRDNIRAAFLRIANWIDRIMGAILIALAVLLAFSSLK